MDFIYTPTMELISVIMTIILLLLIVYSVTYSVNRNFKIRSNVAYMQAEWNDREYVKKRAEHKKRLKTTVIVAVVLIILAIYPIMHYNPLYEVVKFLGSKF